MKKIATMKNKFENLIAHMNRLGLNENEIQPFIIRLENSEPLNVVKNDVNAYFIEKYKTSREMNRNKLTEELKKYNLNRTNFDYIMKKYNETYIPPNKLINEAKLIENFRKHERWVESDEELIDYLNRLTVLKPEDRRKITTALNSYYVGFIPLKKSATNMAIKSANATRAQQRKNLIQHINKVGLKNRTKMLFLRNFDTNVANLNTLKMQINQFKSNKNNENAMKKQDAFLKYLDTLLFLDDKDKMKLLNDYSMKGEVVRNEAAALNALRKKQGIFNFQHYVKNNLGLDVNNKRISNLISEYERYPVNINRHMNKARKIKMENELKELSDMALQSGIKFEIDLSQISTPNDAEKARLKLLKALTNKKGREYTELREAVKNMSPLNQNVILKNFASKNVSLKNTLKTVDTLKKKRADEKAAAERTTLYNFMNKELDMNVEDRNTVLKEFDAKPDIDTAMQRARNLKQKRVNEKISQNRLKVEKITEALNLSKTDRNLILRSFNTKPGAVLAFETQAKNIKKRRENEKRMNERKQLLAHIQSLKLSATNTKKILDIFDQNTEKNLSTSKADASNLRIQRNRERLTGVMKNLIISDEEKKKILKNFRITPSKVKTLITRAKRIDTKARGQLRLQSRLRNYVVSLRLGKTGSSIIKKIDKTLTPQKAKIIKAEADKAKAEANAVLIQKKKNEIRKFMDKSELSTNVKRSILGSVKLSTNVDTLKRKIQGMTKDMKTQMSRRGKLKTELKIYLDTLDLTYQQKRSLLGSVGKDTKSIASLKSKARGLVRQAGRARLDKHLYGLSHLSSNEIKSFTKEFMQGIKPVPKIFSNSTAKNKWNEKRKRFFMKIIPTLKINDKLKNQYISALKQPRVNVDAMEKSIRNISKQNRELYAQLKNFK